jgi:hypothetical protein
MQNKVVMKGYDLFKLSDQEICNRLSLAFYPDNSFPAIDYTDPEKFQDYIFSSLVRYGLTDEYYSNVQKLYRGDATVIKNEACEKLLSIRERCLCALKTYYENKDFML